MVWGDTCSGSEKSCWGPAIVNEVLIDEYIAVILGDL